MSQKKNNSETGVDVTVRIRRANVAPVLFITSSPIGDEMDLGKILRHGVAKFIEEKVPAKHRENLHHD